MTKTIVTVAFILCLTGCSAFPSSKQTLSFNCNQPDVVIKVNGDRFTCPSTVDVRRDSKVVIEAAKDGYEPYNKTVDYHFSTTAKLDMVGTATWFFPVFGLMFPGAWDLDQTTFDVKLYKFASGDFAGQ